MIAIILVKVCKNCLYVSVEREKVTGGILENK